jgi:hypothetical protein
MNNSEIRFTLDLQKPQSQVSIPVKLGDTARTLRITITDGGEPFVIADSCIAMLSAVKSNGYKIFDECIIEEGAIIRYDFNEHTATAEGITECEIVLYGDNNNTDTAVVVGSARFIMVVDAQVLARKDDVLETYTEDDDLGGFDGIISAEVSRREAEEARVEAENARVEAEEEREKFINSLVWETKVNDSEMPPTSKAVKEYSVKREVVEGFVPKVYGASKTDGDVMFKAVMSPPDNGTSMNYDEYCLPRYDWNGNITTSTPVSDLDCANKSYVDQLRRRVESLAYAANGNIYENVTLSGTAHAVQVKNACPYGIISRVGDNVAIISVDKFYNLDQTVTYAKDGADKSCRINGDGTVTIPVGRTYYIEFPCFLPAGVTITVNATGENSKGEKVSNFTVNDGMSSARVGLGKSLELKEAVTKLRIWKDAPGTATTEELTVGDILITVDNPASLTDDHLKYNICKYPIPASVRDIETYEYFDLSKGKVMTLEGEEIAVEITADSDVFKFEPNAVIRLFANEDGENAVTSYTLNYKNKL